ncbi:MAG TPA: hypothetical protein DCL77_13380 [Prolixibacteraceae bacterium]|jgi:hypothetical protein|nr:hypothetical protein [Prolixibacteraceae bacterium]
MTIITSLKSRFFLLFFIFGFALYAQSQSYVLTGKMVDKETQMPMSGVYLLVKNVANDKHVAEEVTDKSGSFSFPNLKANSKYQLIASFLGYSDLVIPIEGNNKNLNLGTLFMAIKSQAIGEVLIQSDASTAVQKGDTIEMNANAFKTTADASAEDLVMKMPGITQEDGAVIAHGKEVKKILVDGKDFFGEDPSAALKSLPAEVIDKIQIFDKLSEQAQFTGFDDGESDQTINIITKKDKKNGTFGKFNAGTNFDDKYLVDGNINVFNHQRRISVLGLFNNINQQNFSQQDLIGVSPSVNSKHDGGFSMGQQVGLTTTRSVGINYSDNFGKKITLTGSYLFNSTNNYTDQISLKDKFFSPKPDHFSNERDTIRERKLNHRIHIRFEYKIDSANTIISTPKLTFQSSTPDKYLFKTSTKNGGTFVNEEGYRTKSDLNNYNLENELVFKHKLHKARRTFSMAVTTAATNKDINSTQMGYYRNSPFDSIPNNEYVDGSTDSYKVSSKMEYIEPLSRISMLHFNLTNAYTNSRKNREAFNVDDSAQRLNRIDSLSDIYKIHYFNNHIGMSYLLKSKGVKLSAGFEYQQASMMNPQNSANDKTFSNFLPNFLLNLKYPKSSLRILYKTSTNAPSITQLQNVIDNTDPTNLSTGNPFLTQEYQHDLSLNFSHANPQSSINYTFYASAEHCLNFIGSKILKATRDTFIPEAGIVLLKNIELDYPVNLDHSTNIKTVFNFGFPFKFLYSKINLLTGFNYIQTPGIINNNLNRYSLYSTVNGFTINSDISEDIDFSLSYTMNYNIVKNSIITSAVNLNNNPKFVYQTVGGKFTWVFWKGFVLHSDALKQFETGFLNFNQTDLLVNGYLGKKFMKGQNGELRLGFFDLLNQYQNIVHTVTPQYIKDIRTNNLGRYYMLTFTYNLNNFKGTETTGKVKKGKKDHKKEMF